MLVDSNKPWIALTKKNEPVSAGDVWRRPGDFSSLPVGMGSPAWVFRGLYSRRIFLQAVFAVSRGQLAGFDLGVFLLISTTSSRSGRLNIDLERHERDSRLLNIAKCSSMPSQAVGSAGSRGNSYEMIGVPKYIHSSDTSTVCVC